jgi:transcriptional regulator with XRE-family HTH domain
MHEADTVGDHVRNARKRRGFSQRELAGLAGVSLSLIKKLEQDDYGDIRLETLHKLAIALRVRTTALASGPDAAEPEREDVEQWAPVRRALDGDTDGEPAEDPTLDGLSAAFARVVPILVANRYAEVRAILPALLRDVDALVNLSVTGAEPVARRLRSQVRQVAALLMSHTWQFEAADRAIGLAMEDVSDPLTLMSAVEERCWGLVRQGRLMQTWDLALHWAEDNEPKMSTASRQELAAWGRLLLRAATAAVRDNRPGEARDALRLARMAAVGAGGDFILPYSPWHVFGPLTVSVIEAETAMIQDRPGRVLAIAGQLEGSAFPVLKYAPRHRLDVAQAYAAMRRYPEAVAVLQQMRQVAPQWLVRQRYARDILGKIVQRRRTLTTEMRELADFIGLPL